VTVSDKKVCIWCKKKGENSIEHIVPEALGCPEGFILDDFSVCKKCNNGLGHLDQTLVDAFDIFSFLHGIRRKGNRPPEITNRGNMIAQILSDGPELFFNMDTRAKNIKGGKHLAGFRGAERNIAAKFQQEGGELIVNFSVEFGRYPKFSRGITKIAFSSLAFFIGRDAAIAPEFDPVRAYINKGVGKRPVIFAKGAVGEYFHQFYPPFISANDE
jgi:hypothetical protein